MNTERFEPKRSAGRARSVARRLRPDVLVVEDDAQCRDAMCGLLEDEGFFVANAISGEGAMAVLQSVSPDLAPRLIFLDLVMPRMSGYALLDELRANKHFARIPVVVISARRDIATHSVELDVDGFLAKPADADEVVAMARKFLGEPLLAT